MNKMTAEETAPELYQSVSRAFTVVTDMDGNVLSVNDAVLHLLDLPLQKVFKHSFLSFFQETNTGGDRNFRAFAGNQGAFECSTVLYMPARRPLHLKWHISKMYVHDREEPVMQWWSAPDAGSAKNTYGISAVEVYKSLFNDSPQPMWIYDQETLEFRDVNEAAVTHYGYSREEFLHMTITDIRPQTELGKLESHMISLKPVNVSDKTIWKHRKKDGNIIYVEVQSYNLMYDGHVGRLVSINDVTEKEKIREILLESEARFRNMADNAPVMIWVSNENDKTVYVNKHWTDFTGISIAEAWGDGWDKIVHPDDMRDSMAEYRAGFNERRSVSMAYRLKHRTGEYRWVLDQSVPRFLEDGSFLGYIGSLVDIQDYKVAEEKIRFQAALIENASDVIISTDSQFNVITWNKRAEEMYGLAAKDAIAANIYNLINYDYIHDTADDAQEKLNQHGRWQGELLYRKQDGTALHLSSMVSALKDDTGRVTGYIAVNRDITEKIAAEEMIRRNELKFKVILQNLIDVVFVMDRSGIIRYVTPSVNPVLGYADEELVGRHAYELIHPEDLKRSAKLFDELVTNTGSTIITDIRILHRRNTWSWVEAKGVNKFSDSILDGVIVSLHDISERKQAEQQLQSYSAHITNILSSITDGFVALDNDFKIVWWNATAEQLTGIRDVDVLGKNIFQAFPELEKERRMARFMRLADARKGFSFELYIRKLKLYFDISSFPSQQGLFIYFKDITYRKKQQMLVSLEKEVLELNINPESSLKDTIDYFLLGIEKFYPGLLCSVLLLEEDGKTVRSLSSPSLPVGFIQAVNGLEVGPRAGSCGTAIYLRKTIVVSDIQQDPLWEDYKALAGRFKLAACWSFPIVTSSNKVLGSFAAYYRTVQSPTEEQLELLKRAGTLMGVIIENKHAGQEINVSNERYMLATRATNDAIWDYNIKSRELYWGENFYSIFGYSPAEHDRTGRFWLTKVHPDDRERVSKVYADAIVNKSRDIVCSEYRFQKADDSYLLVADRAFLICDSDGKAIRFVGAMQDITERKQLESQLLTQEVNRQKTIAQAVVDAQEKERAEIGKELHDNVNQILSTAKLYLELAKTDTRQKDALIKRSADSIFTAINEIRHISKALVPPSVKDLGLIESVNDLVESLQMTNAIKVQFRHNGDFDKTINDKQKMMLFRIIQEQVSNVLKHAEASRIDIDLHLEEKLILLSIVDNGKGFELEKVKFKKGVGLSNIESRAHLFNGEVIITTAPGDGCKLFIQVPINNT